MISLINLLNFLSIFLSVFFQILLVRSFGASLQTDTYYITIGITQFFNSLFLGYITDLFIPVYNEVKLKSKEESLRFTGAVFLLILFIGSLLSIIIFLSAPFLVKIFATGFNDEKIIFSAKLIKILSVTIIFSSLNGLMIAALHANLFLTTTYLTALTTPALNNISLIFFTETYGVRALVISVVVGSIFNFLVLFSYYCKKVGWKVGNPYGNADIVYLLKKNFVLRSADFINYLKRPFTTNVLSYFPLGYITLFSYTDKILNILFRITNSPMLNILFIKSSKYLAKKKIEEIKSMLNSTIRSNIILFICMLVPTIILFKGAFEVVFVNKLSPNEISTMYSLFLCLIPYYLTLSLELPFTNITKAMKKGFKVLEINIISVILYSLLLLSGLNYLKMYSIPIAWSCAQLYNTMSYIKFVNNQFHFLDRNLVKLLTILTLLGISLILINFILRNNFFIQLYSNLLLLSLWMLFSYKDIVAVFSFVTHKGEIK